MAKKHYSVQPHRNAWRHPGVGWETVFEVMELIGPMVHDSWIYDVKDLGQEAEVMMKQWVRSELPGPIFADWIEDRAPEHYALSQLLIALRSEGF